MTWLDIVIIKFPNFPKQVTLNLRVFIEIVCEDVQELLVLNENLLAIDFFCTDSFRRPVSSGWKCSTACMSRFLLVLKKRKNSLFSSFNCFSCSHTRSLYRGSWQSWDTGKEKHKGINSNVWWWPIRNYLDIQLSA